MSMDWFRHSNGMSTDATLTFLAKQAGARRCEMTALWNCLCEHASAHEDRGFVGDIDLEEISFSQDIPLVTLQALHALLCNKGRVTQSGRLKHWERYNDVTRKQPMTGAERVAKYRANKKNKENNGQQDLNLNVTLCNESNDVTTHNSTLQEREYKNSPLPPQHVDKSKSELSKNLKKDFEKSESDYNILDYVDRVVTSCIAADCPEWDIKVLAQHFNKNIRSGKFEIPRDPEKAFQKFCQNFTKGKKP